ncbi:uncharacterized protein J7T54_005970 [Emericellopsis cladophorae]|uniref:DUF3074 domain-containing protein n=1 Tax=Emericellopsis cladophorae TaxID=2686198 RepID=A0A9P9Y8X0_9HYPO|nr:uncharacterized protein J7T54_005970 [Emericellopsis cladophorae]KAI6785636.1 hypothetical protein J7T54_005970 [Emericellopsis cladophorae]
MTEHFGPLVRLWGIQPSLLPSTTASSSELMPFLTSIINEALPFIDDVASTKQNPYTSSWTSKGHRTFGAAASPVYLYSRDVSTAALQAILRDYHVPELQEAVSLGKLHPESWFLRRSVHENAAKRGTARWDEWVKCFKVAHAEAEKAFTPTVVSTRVIREWDCQGVQVERDGDMWGDWTLKMEESAHKLPSPLAKRVFPVLQATTSLVGGDHREFLVVQINAGDVVDHVDVSREYKADGAAVRAKYTSIERVRETDEGIEWIMGTASDAEGFLPVWLQKMAMPKEVAKDVGMFLSWIDTQRNGASEGAPPSGGLRSTGGTVPGI